MPIVQYGLPRMHCKTSSREVLAGGKKEEGSWKRYGGYLSHGERSTGPLGPRIQALRNSLKDPCTLSNLSA